MITMDFNNIAIIGAGNLGLSIATGLVNSKLVEKTNLILTEKSGSRIKSLTSEGYQAILDNVGAVQKSDLIMLVVKPWQIDGILEEIKSIEGLDKKAFVSCVTGVTSDHIFEILESKPALFRVMPNTGVAIQQSMSCISAFNETEAQKESIQTIFEQLGQVLFYS